MHVLPERMTSRAKDFAVETTARTIVSISSEAARSLNLKFQERRKQHRAVKQVDIFDDSFNSGDSGFIFDGMQ